MKAYKATNEKMQCLEFQYELNQEFIHDGSLILCENGFHFCQEMINIFNYYNFSPANRFFEVEIPDDAEIIGDYNKAVTNKIKFIRELSLDEIKKFTNGECYVDTEGRFHDYGDVSYYNDNKNLHRDDGPARILSNGDQEWWQNGVLHRDDGPAIIRTDGMQEWWQNGKLHREDGPAIIYADGGQEWYRNDMCHRDDGPAFIDADGGQEWWENGVFIK